MYRHGTGEYFPSMNGLGAPRRVAMHGTATLPEGCPWFSVFLVGLILGATAITALLADSQNRRNTRGF